MKISASIYSDGERSLTEVIRDLEEHQVDLLHVDCKDDPSVFKDISQIRKLCDLAIDLHLITSDPEKYYKDLRENPVEYVTFQHEDLPDDFLLPDDIPGKKGLAVVTPTPVDVFKKYENFDFILIMATTPGESGGKFDTQNFGKIRSFRNQFPEKSIHVDGGVNPEVSFILRNMGVTCAVSGSYLFNSASVGNALMNLTKRDVESHYQVGEFMVPINEAPHVFYEELSTENVLRSIEDGKLGFTLVLDDGGSLRGLISNADVRKAMLSNLDDLNRINPVNFINLYPTTIDETATVLIMLKLIKKSSFPIMYLPVVDDAGLARGIVTFVNLVKGEL